MLSACLRFAVLLRRSCAHPPLPPHTCRCPVFVPCVPSPVYIVLRLHTLCTYCAYSLYISSTHSMPGCTAAAPCWTRRVPGHASSVHIPLPWRRHARTAPCTLLLAAHSPGEPSPHSAHFPSRVHCAPLALTRCIIAHPAARSCTILHNCPRILREIFLSRMRFRNDPSLYLSSCSIPCC